MKTETAQQLRFPWKLHLLLERTEQQGSSSDSDAIISWMPEGKSFRVHDKERFASDIMPEFFGTQNFKTFQRNLNLWGFTRVSKGPNKDVCSHPLFMRGFPALCQSMRRIVLKGTGRGNRAPCGGVDVKSIKAALDSSSAATNVSPSLSPLLKGDSPSVASSTSPSTKKRAAALSALPKVPGMKKAFSKTTIMMPNCRDTTTSTSQNATFTFSQTPAAASAATAGALGTSMSSSQRSPASKALDVNGSSSLSALLGQDAPLQQHLASLIQKLHHGGKVEPATVPPSTASTTTMMGSLKLNHAMPTRSLSPGTVAALLSAIGSTPTPAAATSTNTQDLIQMLLLQQQRKRDEDLLLQHRLQQLRQQQQLEQAIRTVAFSQKQQQQQLFHASTSNTSTAVLLQQLLQGRI